MIRLFERQVLPNGDDNVPEWEFGTITEAVQTRIRPRIAKLQRRGWKLEVQYGYGFFQRDPIGCVGTLTNARGTHRIAIWIERA